MSLWIFARLRLCLNNTLRILQGLLAGRLAQECQLKSLKQQQDAADILSLQISLLTPRCFIYSSKIVSWCKIMHPSHSQKVEIVQIGLLSAKESYFIHFWSTQSDNGRLCGNIKALPVEPVQTLRHQTGCRAYSFVCVHVASKQIREGRVLTQTRGQVSSKALSPLYKCCNSDCHDVHKYEVIKGGACRDVLTVAWRSKIRRSGQKVVLISRDNHMQKRSNDRDVHPNTTQVWVNI